MKKTLSLLTLATFMTAFAGMAHAENLTVNNVFMSMDSMEITVIEIDRKTLKETPKDHECLPVNTRAVFQNYLPEHTYKVIAEIKSDWCQGATKSTIAKKFDMNNRDMQADANENFIEIKEI